MELAPGGQGVMGGDGQSAPYGLLLLLAFEKLPDILLY